MAAVTRRQFVSLAALGAALSSVRADTLKCSSGCIRLPDGRRLAYSEYGNPAGTKVVIHHHALPGSRREAEVFRDFGHLAKTPEVRLISFDRPGFGDSDPVAAKSFCGWVPDLIAAAHALKVDRFAITAFSGGVPYALAAAIAHPDRVTRIATACAAGEHVKGLDNGKAAKQREIARDHPRLFKAEINLWIRSIERNPKHATRPITGLLQKHVPKETELFKDPVAVEFAAAVMKLAFKQGALAMGQEAALLTGPWRLDLAGVKASTTLWHGESDEFSPPWMSEVLAKAIPGAECHLSPGDGHLSIVNNRAGEIWAAATA